MQYDVNTVEEYIGALPEDRKPIVEKLRNAKLSNLPEGYVEQISYRIFNYVVPLSKYPKGYYAKKKMSRLHILVKQSSDSGSNHPLPEATEPVNILYIKGTL